MTNFEAKSVPVSPPARTFLDVVVSDVLDANCYVVVSPDARAVVIDPGFDVAERVDEILESRGATLDAVLISHGHLDHVADIARLVRRWSVPVVIGRGDAYRLVDPVSQLPQQFIDLFRASRGEIEWQAPGQVREVGDTEAINFGCLVLYTVRAPGHTEGSTLYRLDLACGAIDIGPGIAEIHGGRLLQHIRDAAGLIFSGDVLFAGSIGRCDLPGGDETVMQDTLRTVIAQLPPNYAVLAGHGPTSTVHHELASNPHLWSVR